MCVCKCFVLYLTHFFNAHYAVFTFTFHLSLSFFFLPSFLGTSPASSTPRRSMWCRITTWVITQKVPEMSPSWLSYLSTGSHLLIRNLLTRTILQPQITITSRPTHRTSGSSSSSSISSILQPCITHSINIQHSSRTWAFSINLSLLVHLKVFKSSKYLFSRPKKKISYVFVSPE